ncbi:IS3 family transposase [Leifsonia aquatica]|uniref:IS3 family transposase n=1 Tax=Leifsonia aquatica TaxID=144185 RepID=UPI000E20743F|nr:IS3 family transposase [Leifsonia aquatica]
MRDRALRMLAQTRPAHPNMMSVSREGALPPLTEMIRFINAHRDRFGVELIWRVLRPAVQGFFTSRSYHDTAGRAPSARQLKDELLAPEVATLHAENYGVYGHRKMHALMRQQGWEIGRGQTGRLMLLAGVRGVKTSKTVLTICSDKTTALPNNLVKRCFTAPATRRLWVCDVTDVAAWSGFDCVPFVDDVYSRRIIGWNVASTLRSEIVPMQALDMAGWEAGGRLDGLIHHADHGSNYTGMVYTDQILELGVVPSTVMVGDSLDNAMAEAVNNLYKTELNFKQGPIGQPNRSSSRPSCGCSSGTTPASTARSTCEPPPRSRTRITLTSNQSIRLLQDKAPDKHESQADSVH